MRHLFKAVAAFGVLVALPAMAADFPAKNIEFVIPVSPGGGFDTYVRAVSPVMEKHLPQSVNVVPTNVPAAGGARGAAQVFRAKPDGYTIGIFNIPGILVPQLRGDSSVQYDLTKLTWLGSFGSDEYGVTYLSTEEIDTIKRGRAGFTFERGWENWCHSVGRAYVPGSSEFGEGYSRTDAVLDK